MLVTISDLQNLFLNIIMWRWSLLTRERAKRRACLYGWPAWACRHLANAREEVVLSVQGTRRPSVRRTVRGRPTPSPVPRDPTPAPDLLATGTNKHIHLHNSHHICTNIINNRKHLGAGELGHTHTVVTPLCLLNLLSYSFLSNSYFMVKTRCK